MATNMKTVRFPPISQTGRLNLTSKFWMTVYVFFLSFPVYKACVSCHSRIQLPFPHLNFFFGGGRLFCKFWRYNTLNIPIFKSTYNVYNYIFLLSSLTTKTWGICEGASKQFPDPKNFTALHGSEIPGSYTAFVQVDFQVHDDFKAKSKSFTFLQVLGILSWLADKIHTHVHV